MQVHSIVSAFLILLGWMTVSNAICSFGIGDRVPGQQLLHNITITKGPLEVEQLIQLELNYRASPLQNEVITFVQLDGTGPGCSASINSNVDRKKQFLGTVSSVTQLKEFTVHLSVYGTVGVNAQ